MKHTKFIVIYIIFSFLSACSQFGAVAPQSIDEQIGYGYGTVSAVRTSAAQMLSTGTITVADAQKVQALADQARTMLDSARTALPVVSCVSGSNSACDTSTAAAKLALATQVLTALQQFLQSIQKR